MILKLIADFVQYVLSVCLNPTPNTKNQSLEIKESVSFVALPLNFLPLKFEDTGIIRQFEGFSLKAYPDPATGGEPFTIAWGLTGAWVKKDMEITEEEAKSKYNEYIQVFSSKLDNLLKVKLTKNQYIAVLSLMWNIGAGALGGSTLLHFLNEGKYPEAAEQFLRWNKAAGKIMPGLTKRREQERALFLS